MMLAPPLPALTSTMPAAFKLNSVRRITTGLTRTLDAINSDVTLFLSPKKQMVKRVCTATVKREVIFMIFRPFAIFYTVL